MEVLTTENAISTYNYLLEEGRVVAAALIPPAYVRLARNLSTLLLFKRLKTLIYFIVNCEFNYK